MSNDQSPIEFIDLREVSRRTSMKRSYVYSAVARGEFPAPVRISSRCSRWNAAEVDQWQRDRLAERNAA